MGNYGRVIVRFHFRQTVGFDELFTREIKVKWPVHAVADARLPRGSHCDPFGAVVFD